MENARTAETPETLLDDVLAQYLLAEEQGQSPDPREWMERYPTLGEPLERFLRGHSRLQARTEPLRAVARACRGRAAPPKLAGYELLDEVGRGGMGIVYRANQVSLGRLVAVKVIRAGSSATPVEVRRFLREAEAVAQLDHPHIVPVYEVGGMGGGEGPCPFFAMKLMEGGSLAESLTAGRWTPSRRADQQRLARLVATIAAAVHHAHQRGILHRDLKPSNILLDADGQPFVSDFGLMCFVEREASLSQPGAVVGTPTYMAPEQAAPGCGRTAVTTVSDIYALGAILYALLTGRPPLQGATPLETLLLVRERDPIPPRRACPTLDRDLETICLKCLEKDPAHRYASAQGLAEDLGRWVDGRPILARPAGALKRLTFWCRRNKALAGLSLLTGLALLVALVVLSVSVVVVAAARTTAEGRAADLRRQVYVADVGRAHRAWQRGDLGTLSALLAPYQGADELVGFEWHYLRGLASARWQSRPICRHTDIVYATTFSPDGRTVASGGADGIIRLTDLETGTSRELGRHADDVNGLSFSPDGRLLASASDDDTVRLWDLATGQDTPLPDAKGAGECVEFSPDGKLIAAAGKDARIRLWDVATGLLTAQWAGHRVIGSMRGPVGIEALAFTPDGRRLASAGHDSKLCLWDVAQRRLVVQTNNHHGSVLAVASSQDGQFLATADRSGFIMLHRAADLSLHSTPMKHDGSARGVSFSADGRWLASCGDDGRLALCPVGGSAAPVYETLRDVGLWSVAFAPTGLRLVTGGSDIGVRLWQAGGPRGTASRGILVQGPARVAFLGEGQRLASWAPNHGVKRWEPGRASWREVSPIGDRGVGRDGRVAVSPGGSWFAVADDDSNVHIFDGHEGKRLRTFPRGSFPPRGVQRNIEDLAFTGNGRHLAVLHDTRTLVLWNLEHGDARTLQRPFDGEGTLAASPDGKTLAMINGKFVHWIDVESGVERGQALPLPGGARCAAYSPDGRTLAIGGNERSLRLIDVATGQARLLEGHRRAVSGVAFSPDGRTLASCGLDGSLRLWHPATGQELLTLRDHPESPLLSVSFSPDGRTLAASVEGLHDGVNVLFWEATQQPP